jgi:hypothetical protein
LLGYSKITAFYALFALPSKNKVVWMKRHLVRSGNSKKKLLFLEQPSNRLALFVLSGL